MKISIPEFNPKKPTVFLDIDGVLNHECYYRRITEIDPEFHFDKLHDFDPRSCEILNEIWDWNFVLSSSWRISNTLDDVNNYLTYNGFRGKIISSTPIIENDYCVRGNEIRKWIIDNIRSTDLFRNNYVIFDDDSDFLLEQRNNFFHVDRFAGITPNIIYKAKRFFQFNKNLENDNDNIGDNKDRHPVPVIQPTILFDEETCEKIDWKKYYPF